MQCYHTISITHKTAPVSLLGTFVLEEDRKAKRLQTLRDTFNLDELFYISTCNRVAFTFITTQSVDKRFLRRLIQYLHPRWPAEQINKCLPYFNIHHGREVVHHLFEVASSMDSMVVGEREILRQLREQFAYCRQVGLTGDRLRLLKDEAVRTAKKVYTDTRIGEKPVSVASLAFREIQRQGIAKTAPILMIGAGQTHLLMAKFLAKHGYTNITLYNRTPAKAKAVAQRLNITPRSLSDIANHQAAFEVLLTCTAASQPILTKSLFDKLPGSKACRLIIDLAVPQDISDEVASLNSLHYLAVPQLKEKVQTNLSFRQKELDKAVAIIHKRVRDFQACFEEREVELVMREIPRQIKDVRKRALEQVFSKEVNALDTDSREVLDKVLNYMEKKYISIPMREAKSVLLKKA